MKSIKSNFIYNLLLTLSNLLFPVISFPYVSRIIGPEGIGRVQFLMTFAQYFVLVAALGIPIYGLREVAKLRNDVIGTNKLFSELFFINIITSLLLSLIYFILIFTIDRFNDGQELYLISALLILLSFTSIDWFYSGIEDFKYIAIRSVIVKITALIALFIFVTNKNDVLSYLIISIFAILGNNILNLLYLGNKVKLLFLNLDFKKHLNILLILFSTSIATSIYTVMDTLMLGFLTNDKTVGYYTAAIKLNKLAIPFVVSFGIVLIPKISIAIRNNDFNETQYLINKSFHFVCLIGIPLCFGLCVLAPEILNIFSGSQFNPAVLTMQLASPLIFLIGLGHVFGLQILIPTHNEKYYLWATIIGMIVSLLCNVFLINLFKDKGAAVATVIGEFFVSSISCYFVVKKLKYNFDWRLILKCIICSMFIIPIVLLFRYLFNELNIIAILILSLVSTILYFTLQIYIFKDIILLEIWKSISNKAKVKLNK